MNFIADSIAKIHNPILKFEMRQNSIKKVMKNKQKGKLSISVKDSCRRDKLSAWKKNISLT